LLLHLDWIFIIIVTIYYAYNAAALAGFPRHIDEGQPDIRDSEEMSVSECNPGGPEDKTRDGMAIFSGSLIVRKFHVMEEGHPGA
jgi:hypothetical protein